LPPPPAAKAVVPPKATPKPSAKEPVPLNTSNRQNSASSQKAAPAAAEAKAKAPTLKRDKSDIFKSFAKTKPPKAKSASQDASTVQDEPMKEMSEDEDEDFVMVEEDKVDEAKVEAARAERAERQKRLRDMMDDDDDDDDDESMADVPAVEEAVDEGSPIDKKPEAEELEETVTVSGGRRRGRRRVMKKKTMKDEEGYMGKTISCMM
jgi:DNA polymerase delta subunit 3